MLLETGRGVGHQVGVYIESVGYDGKFAAQIEQALRRRQVVIFRICGAIAFVILLAAV